MRTATRCLLIAFVSGCAFKAAWLWTWKTTQVDWLFTGLTSWDLAPLQFALLCAELFFDHRGIAPSDAEVRWFDALLVIGSGLQWALVALNIRAIHRRIYK